MTSENYLAQLDAAIAFMKEGDDFLVVSHVQPDGDAISSTSVIAWLLNKLGKKAVLMNEGEPPSRLSYLYQFDAIINYRKTRPETKFTKVITVDCADYKRIGEVTALFAPDVQMVNIDHHPTNDGFGSVNIILDHAAATVEILYDLIERAGIELDLDCATAIYTGLLTDTGGFRYSNTSSKVMAIASRLLEFGVRGHQLADHLLEKMTMPKLKLLQRSLSRLTFSEDQQIGWLYIAKDDMRETGAVSDDFEGIVNYALNIDGVEVGILFKETDDGQVKASLRSAGKVDVAAIAQSFGGGGHVRAAGCRLEGPLAESTQTLVEAVRKALTQ
ncbi:bifunctional oligoribonuclease/PAP phosphatase NrnA [Paenibacillus sp. NEAU-GSW1]|uniref:DHH family phosphoesterase n=1 Tax=Paenibacillus sp. NEAU-GSW1 TaxID=2682486 RepID=UPI0012E31852|nr:bifunctional oligoribonuclease/PAP phosphatase NrnA [Paenibacillus sp. NEAU-GSW1]MUT66400.1 bifunctional oligoribonuclease/PAP phosphatase NrnA [Paenibacillus sp. NEAU-GSW1]